MSGGGRGFTLTRPAGLAGWGFTLDAGRLCTGRRGVLLRLWTPGREEARYLGLEVRTVCRVLGGAVFVGLLMLR